MAMVFCGVAVLGSYSRGALLAVAAMGAFLWRKSRQRLPLLLFAIILVPPLVAFMPDKWFERMDTISSYEKDASANARLNSWTTMVNIANDRPIYGGGFMIARPEVYQRYSPVPDIESHSAHSIYFQVLGEHGYVGLALYLLLLHAAWRKAGWIMRAAKDRADLAWARDLSAMMQVTLVGFAVGGAFLSLVNYDVPYYLIALLSVTLTLVEKELKTQAPAPAAAPAPSAAFVRNRLPRPGSR